MAEHTNQAQEEVKSQDQVFDVADNVTYTLHVDQA